MTGQGYGPISAIEEAAKVKVLFLQFYLLSLLFTTLPLAALLIVRQRLAKRLEQSNRWLLQAEAAALVRSEEHTSELQSLMRISYAVFCLKKKKKGKERRTHHTRTQEQHRHNTEVDRCQSPPR